MSPLSNPLVFELNTLELTLCVLIVMAGILIFQTALSNRRLKRIDQMLRMLPKVVRSDRRAA